MSTTEHKGNGVDLAAIRERCEKASREPWAVSDSPGGMHIFSKAEAKALGVARGQLIGAIAIVCKEFGQPFEANRDFIARARTDIPLLLDALAAAQAYAGEAYREALKAAGEVVKGRGCHCTIDMGECSNCLAAQAILTLPVPEKFGGGK